MLLLGVFVDCCGAFLKEKRHQLHVRPPSSVFLLLVHVHLPGLLMYVSFFFG